MKKLLVTYKVKDAEWWLSNNTLDKVWGPMGIKLEIFAKKNSNLVGYVCNIPNNNFFEEIVQNTTLLSDSFKANGVLTETIEILELVET